MHIRYRMRPVASDIEVLGWMEDALLANQDHASTVAVTNAGRPPHSVDGTPQEAMPHRRNESCRTA